MDARGLCKRMCFGLAVLILHLMEGYLAVAGIAGIAARRSIEIVLGY